MRQFLLSIVVPLFLCSCANDSPVRTSTSFNGWSPANMNMADPHFYMDDDETTPGVRSQPPMAQHYGIDGYCGAGCQRRFTPSSY